MHSYDTHVKHGPVLAGSPAARSVIAGPSESKHVQFVRGFATAASLLQSKTSALQSIYDNVQNAINEIQTCLYDAPTFSARLEIIQTAVDQLNLENYTNLAFWVSDMNQTIEKVLIERLHQAMHAWVESFNGSRTEKTNDNGARGKTPADDDQKPNVPSLRNLVL